ncbi:hypothetical protein Tco_1124032 [Tanacetum coccineum]|uniref:Uncharacterized protein n=1 Tax=Tanacetum coccineum TaxID=301880 RepID=A0ABQ5J4Y9_9ASTR
MVAYLEKTEENADFHQILDFLTSSSINVFSLGSNLIHYQSFIAFSFKSTSWDKFSTNLAFFTTIVASQPPKDPSTYRRTKRGQNTKVPQSGDYPYKVGDEAINEEMLNSMERAATTATSLEAEQASGNIHKTQFTARLNESFFLELGLGSSPWHQETIGGMQAQTRSEGVSNLSSDPPLSGGVKHLECDDVRLKLEELMAMCTKLSKEVLDLEKEKDAQVVEILKLKKRVKKLERKRKSSISHSRRRIYRQVESSDYLDEEDTSKQGRNENVEGETVSTDRPEVSTASVPVNVSVATPVTPPTTTTIFDDDEDLTIVQTLVKIRSEKAKEKGVAFRDVEETPRLIRSITTLQPLLTIDPKDKERDAEVALRLQAELDEELRVERERQEEASKVAIAEMFDEVQARIDADYELAPRMTQKEQEKYAIEERARLLVEFFKRRKKQLAAERVEAIRNKPPTKTQLRNLMMTYLKNMGGYKHSQLKGKSYEEIQGLYERQQKRIQDFTPMDSKKEAQKSGKRLKRVARSYATQKSPKKPKVIKSAKDVTEEEATEYEKEKEELRLVQERFQDHPLEGHDLLLWGDLRMIFDPDEKDELWLNQLD